MSKETNLSEIWDGDQVSKKLRQSKNLCKQTKKICKMFMIYIYIYIERERERENANF